MRQSRSEAVEWLRGIGAMLLAAGALVALIRKSSGQGWNDFDRMLVLLAPATLLYILALEGTRPLPRGSPGRTAQLVTSILLAPLAFAETLRWLGANTGNDLYNALIFALTGLLAAFGSTRVSTPFARLLAALAGLAAWLFLWDKILRQPSAGTFRWLLVSGGAVLLLLGAVSAWAGSSGGAEVATAGAIGLVVAGVIGVVIGGFGAVFIAALPEGIGHLHAHLPARQTFGWDLYLLIVSLGLAWAGARVPSRGLGYVGGAGLFGFALSVGLRVSSLESHGVLHTGTALGAWPIALIAIGLIAVLAPVLRARA